MPFKKGSSKNKGEMKDLPVSRIAEALDKNTSKAHQVWSIIHAMQDACEYIEDKRYQYRNNLPFEIRCMRECLVENLDYTEERKRQIISLFDDITDCLQEAIMLAGENAEGLITITSPLLREELHEISDVYNS